MLLHELSNKGLIREIPPWMPDNCMYLVLMGSEAYGVSSGDSDRDLYGYAIPPKHMVFPHMAGHIFGFGEHPAKPYNVWQKHHIRDGSTQYDLAIYSIIRYVQLVMDNNPNMVDSLFVSRRCILHSTPVAELLRDKRDIFLHKGCWHKFKGYSYSQLAKAKGKGHKHLEALVALEDEWEIPRETTLEEAKAAYRMFCNEERLTGSFSHFERIPGETLEEYCELYEKMVQASNRAERCKIHGWDTKFLYHVVRLMLECEQILQEGTLVLDEKGRREQMKAIRRGEWSIEVVEDFFQRKERYLENLYESSRLRYSPDSEAIKELLLTCLEQHYGSLDACVVREDEAVRALREVAEVIDRNRKVVDG